MSMTAKFDVANQLDVRYDVFAASLYIMYLNNKCLTLWHAKVTSISVSAYSAGP